MEYYCSNNSAYNITLSCDCIDGACTKPIEGCSGADINKDGIVNDLDLSILAGNWQQNCSSYNYCSGADINKDGKVNDLDLATLAGNWQRSDCYPPTGFIQGVVDFFRRLFGLG